MDQQQLVRRTSTEADARHTSDLRVFNTGNGDAPQPSGERVHPVHPLQPPLQHSEWTMEITCINPHYFPNTTHNEHAHPSYLRLSPLTAHLLNLISAMRCYYCVHCFCFFTMYMPHALSHFTPQASSAPSVVDARVCLYHTASHMKNSVLRHALFHYKLHTITVLHFYTCIALKKLFR